MPSILLIGDDQFLAEIFQKKLEGEGCNVRQALNGEQGVEEAQKYRPDVIVLGIALPRKNGFEVLEELKAEAATKDIPVIIYSSLGSREDVQRCFEGGACEYMIKAHHPPEDVLSRVRHYVSCKPGFTLTETLVVIGIIVMAGLLAFFQYQQYLQKQQQMYPQAPILEEGEQATSTDIFDES
jgi:prepilin-type N-terminal cleavage/methylation domain-containing protein